MIAKIFNISQTLSSGANNFNVKTFKSAILLVDMSVSDESNYLTISVKDNAGNYVESVLNGVKSAKNLKFPKTGKSYVYIDCEFTENLIITVNETGEPAWNAVLSTSNDRQNVDFYNNDRQIKSDDIVFKDNSSIVIEVPNGSKQADFVLDFISNNSALDSGAIIQVQTSIDGVTYNHKTFNYKADKNEKEYNLFKNDYNLSITQLQHIDAFINVESVKYIKITSYKCAGMSCKFSIDFTDTYKDRIIIYHEEATKFSKDDAMKGYRFVKYLFDGTTVTGGGCRLIGTRTNQDDIKTKRYNLAMQDANTFWNLGNYSKIIDGSEIAYLYGNVASGGIILEYKDALLGNIRMYKRSVGDYTPDVSLHCIMHLSDKKFDTISTEKIKERSGYTIYKTPMSKALRDVYNYDVLEYSTTTLDFYMNGYYGVKYSIEWNRTNVPALKDGETIRYAYLLPFNIKYRDSAVGSENYPSRIMVVTNKNRIFHNFPFGDGSRSDRLDDLFHFDESALFVPNVTSHSARRWRPVNDKSKQDARHKYFPVLGNYDYNQFDGRIGVGYYGDSGLTENSQFNLFDFFNIDNSIQRLAYSTLTKDAKFCTWGNYNVLEGSEPFVMCTNNGGRTWYVMYMFACTDEYTLMNGGSINMTPIFDEGAEYVPNSLKLGRKRFNVPNVETKEPSTPFIVREEDKSLVTSMTYANGNTIITLADDLFADDPWSTGNFPIVFFENVSANSEYDYICNNGFTADGSTNNGVFFRLKRTAPKTYTLLADFGNPYVGDIFCRHIHAVNATANGVIISTGESYTVDKHEGGFLYMMESVMRNGNNTVSLDSPNSFPLKRITSTKEGINRACGAFVDINGTLIYAADESNYHFDKRDFHIEGRTDTIRQGVYGIFIGDIRDCDDISKFSCVCAIKRTLIGLTETHGHFAAQGHNDSICLSPDGKNWGIEESTNDVDINGTDIDGNIYYGDKVVVFR